MADTTHFADGLHVGENTGRFNQALAESGLVSFLVAGAVLFASLVVGSSASLVLAGSDSLMAAILRGFLSLGMWTLAAFVAAIVGALILAAFRGHQAG
jgi:hypothetical protein